MGPSGSIRTAAGAASAAAPLRRRVRRESFTERLQEQELPIAALVSPRPGRCSFPQVQRCHRSENSISRCRLPPAGIPDPYAKDIERRLRVENATGVGGCKMTWVLNDRMRGLAALVSPIAAAAVIVVVSQQRSWADEGGVSFWVPGQFGSLAAVPAQPGWSFASIGYVTDVRASGGVAAARQITMGHSPTVNVDLNATLHARVPTVFVNANHVFETPVLGGQFAFGMTGAAGRPHTSIDGVLTASVGPLTVTRTGSISDERFAFADLYPMATLRWNHGVHNFMIYGTGDIPVGTYDSSEPRQSRHRSRRGRWRLRLHLLQPGDRTRILRRDRRDLQSHEQPDRLSERHRLASGLGRFTVSVEADVYRRGRVRLSAAHRG